jgi:hypothetical protein
MTDDFKTACRELLTRWREAAEYAENEGYMHESDGINGCADELEHALDQHMNPEVKALVEQMENAT